MTTRHGAKYIDTYNAIKMDIITKQYPAGSFLPTESELMEQYKVSRTTIRKAIALLKNDGFVTTTRGRGTEVRTVDNNEGEYPFSTLSGHTEVHTIIRGSDTSSVTAQGATVDIIDAPYQVAEALSIKEGTPIFRLQRIKLIENVPCSYVISYVTCTDFPDLTHTADRLCSSTNSSESITASHSPVRRHVSQPRKPILWSPACLTSHQVPQL